MMKLKNQKRLLKPAILIFILTLTNPSVAQTPVQVIRGMVTDAASKTGLPGANVVILDSDPVKGTTTGLSGEFRIEKVAVGRHSIQVSYMGYKPVVIPEILVSSGKESVVHVELEEMALNAGEVEIRAEVEKDKPVNSMAMVSARSFNVVGRRSDAGGFGLCRGGFERGCEFKPDHHPG